MPVSPDGVRGGGAMQEIGFGIGAISESGSKLDLEHRTCRSDYEDHGNDGARGDDRVAEPGSTAASALLENAEVRLAHDTRERQVIVVRDDSPSLEPDSAIKAKGIGMVGDGLALGASDTHEGVYSNWVPEANGAYRPG